VSGNRSKNEEALSARTGIRVFAFVAVPLVGLVELLLHLGQVGSVVPVSDYAGAKTIITQDLKADDLVLFAPAWNDPVGRETLGNDVITLERAAFPDVSRFPRAYEVSIRGASRPETEGWKVVSERSSGKVTVRLRENPHPVHLLSDLVTLFGPDVKVSRTGGRHGGNGPDGEACGWQHGKAQTGSLGFGPAVPGDRASCEGGGLVGLTVLPALDYTARRCLEATPVGDGASLRMHFPQVAFGHQRHGHHGIYVEAERNKTGAPVTVTFSHGGQLLGRANHRDGDGWSEFSFDTGALAGQTGDLDVEVTSSEANRKYCFEADTR
jgi:hypothetical protein